MNLVFSRTVIRAALATCVAALVTSHTARGQYLEVEPGGTTFAPDTNGSAAYRIDLFNGQGWLGNECRLVSFLGGQIWSIDTPLDLQFTGVGSSLASFGADSEINDALSFTAAGFLTPGAFDADSTRYLGVHREVEDVDYYGALAFRYNQDNSISLVQFGLAAGSFNTAQFQALDPIPEPAGAAVSLIVLALAGAIVRRRKAITAGGFAA